MAGDIVYVSRLLRLGLLDADGETIGSITDVVFGPQTRLDDAPPVLGFVGLVHRREIFVTGSRIRWADARGVQMVKGSVDLRQFRVRPHEVLATSLLGRVEGVETVRDIGLTHSEQRARAWVVATVALRHGGRLGFGGRSRVADWHDVGGLFDSRPLPDGLSDIRRMHPSDAGRRIVALPADERALLLGALGDHALADVLEELPESDQVQLLSELDLARAADVVEEMAPDDATDLLAELSGDRRQQLLDEIDPVQGVTLRRLLSHAADTAGGLMTSDPIVLAPDTPVADALARIRQTEVIPALAAQVFVTEPPRQTPTGTYLGLVSFQRLLQEPPGMPVSSCLETTIEPVSPDLPELAVARRLAAYNLLALPVCDDDGRLLGAVTVDDVLDRSLPSDWRI